MRIILKGRKLRRIFGETVEIASSTVAEAIQGMSFQRFGRPHMGMEIIPAMIPGLKGVSDLFEPTEQTEIELYPMVYGHGGGGWGQIIMGVVLIAASFIPGCQFLLAMGIGMLLQGIVSLLTPMPKIDTSTSNTNDKRSKYLGSPKNTTASGTRIPILYGRDKIGGHFISSDSDSNTVVNLYA